MKHQPTVDSAWVPQFLVVQPPRLRGFCQSVAVVWKGKLGLGKASVGDRQVWTEPRRLRLSILSSLMLHCAAVFFCVQIPLSLFFAADRNPLPMWQQRTNVYELHTITLSDYLPVPPLSGGKPPQEPRDVPARGTTRRDTRVRIISNPPNPDNTRQTIIQSSSPPKLRFSVDLRLPDLFLGRTHSVPPTLQPPPRVLSIKPSSPRPPVADPRPPGLRLKLSRSANLMPALPVPSYAQPTFASVMEIQPGSRRTAPAIPDAPAIRVKPSASANLSGLPVASSAPPALAPQEAQTPQGTPVPEMTSVGKMDTRLTVISVDPGPPVQSVELPPGQRFGKFSISAAETGPGSPDGTGVGSSRDKSAAGLGGGKVSKGDGTDGNGESGPAAHGDPSHGLAGNGISISSPPGVTGPVASTAMVVDIARHIYPVLAPPRAPYKGVVVTAGPQGGGGLHVFGVLRGGKVYTTYLPMPGKNWILEYSAPNRPEPNPNASRAVKIQLDPPLVAPAAEAQFDFNRSAFPKGKPGDMIILKGRIRADGSLDNVTVLKGFDQLTDQAALLAFRRWKFTPAMRAGKPVDVEILVGIPGFCPECR